MSGMPGATATASMRPDGQIPQAADHARPPPQINADYRLTVPLADRSVLYAVPFVDRQQHLRFFSGRQI